MHNWKAACLTCALFVALGISSSAQTFMTITDFGGNAAAAHSSLVQGTDGNFYGTTVQGGTLSCNPPLGCGTVFRVASDGALAVLYRFCTQVNCADGSSPYAGLVLGTDGNFYGTALEGGANNCAGTFRCGGTIFKITPTGRLSTLYSFCAEAGCTDGEFPSVGALIEGSDGNFYGTTSGGGAYASGTIFKITPLGRFTSLYSFCADPGCPDGGDPEGGLVRGADGDLYGTTAGGYGSVFKITPGGTLTTLYRFDSTDATPVASLIQASNGSFYGSTFFGGAMIDNCSGGCGTLFRISASGSLTTLEDFDWSNGANPSAALIQATDGNLYGTTFEGAGAGSIFRLTLRGGLTSLYTFSGGANGLFPFGGLFQATSGIFYGTTAGDGAQADSTVYSLDMGLGPFVAFILSSGKIGQTAQILGQGFTGTTKVTFNGIAATKFTVVNDTYMTAVVPAGATTGAVVVTTPTGNLTSNVSFRITH